MTDPFGSSWWGMMINPSLPYPSNSVFFSSEESPESAGGAPPIGLCKRAARSSSVKGRRPEYLLMASIAQALAGATSSFVGSARRIPIAISTR